MRASVFAVSTVAAALIPAFALAQVTIDERLAPGQQPVIIAHRAIGGGAPEDSLSGVQGASVPFKGRPGTYISLNTFLYADGRCHSLNRL